MPTPTIPPNYPEGCAPAEIRSAIREMQDELARLEYPVNSVLQYSPLINLGQFELERRQNEAIVRQSTRLGYISLGIAVVALVISVLGAAGSSGFERKQLALLESINKNVDVAQTLKQQSSFLEKISTQLSTEITCVLKSDHLKVGKKPPAPGQ